MAGQLRLTEEGENYVPNIKPRGTTTLEPVVARLGINTKMEKPALLLKSENDHKKPEKIFFPPSASQPRKNFFLYRKCYAKMYLVTKLNFVFKFCCRIQSTYHKSFQAKCWLSFYHEETGI